MQSVGMNKRQTLFNLNGDSLNKCWTPAKLTVPAPMRTRSPVMVRFTCDIVFVPISDSVCLIENAQAEFDQNGRTDLSPKLDHA